MSVFDIHAYLEGYPIPGVNQNTAQVMQVLQERGIERAHGPLALGRRVDELTLDADLDGRLGERLLVGALADDDLVQLLADAAITVVEPLDGRQIAFNAWPAPSARRSAPIAMTSQR